MQFRSPLILAGAALAGAMALAQGSGVAPRAQATPPGGTVIDTRPVYTHSMQHLQASADRLREAIQALADQPPGPQREVAITRAHQALLQTQQAMMLLPPDLRSTGTVSGADYDASVRKLMQSADQLRRAIQEMAQQPAGARRNEAIREANQALLDTQVAMANAYRPGTGTAMGASRGGGSSSTANGGAQAPQRPAASPPAALVLLPPGRAGETQLAEGCWVRFYDDKGFKGGTLTLAGPMSMANMDLPSNVWRDWDSAVVGPNATVITYDNENFRDRSSLLRPGQEVPDLRAGALSWFEEVKSAKVSCG